MPTVVYECLLPVPVERVWEFHASAEALYALTPPNRVMRALSDDLEVREGAEHVFAFRQFGIPMVWRARIESVRPPNEFTDVALSSPFLEWRHRHEFLALPDGSTLLRDTLTYRPPLGALADRLFVRRQLDALFAFRHARTREALA